MANMCSLQIRPRGSKAAEKHIVPPNERLLVCGVRNESVNPRGWEGLEYQGLLEEKGNGRRCV
jgi:hypothetical protein